MTKFAAAPVAVVAWLLILAVSATAQSEVVTYEGEGAHSYKESGLADAKVQAADKAMLDAVERAAKDILSTETFVAFRPVLVAKVFPRWGRFVQGYELKKESFGAGVYTVKLRVRVFSDRLKAEIYRLPEIKAQGRMVLLLTFGADGHEPIPAFADAMAERITAADRVLAADDVKQGVLDAGGADRAALGDVEQLKESAKLAGCRFVVIGRVLEADDEGCPSRISMVVLDTDQAEPLLDKNYKVNRQPGECAVTAEGAGVSLGDRVVARLVAERPAETDAPEAGTFRVVADGFERFSDLESVRSLLAHQPGIDDCRLAQASTGSVATYVVRFTGSAEELADLLNEKAHADVLIQSGTVDGSRVHVSVHRSFLGPDSSLR